MQASPVVGANISQTLIMENESLIIPGDSVALAFQNLQAVSGINALPQEMNDMERLMPAYLQQAHLSTYYQDNPWETLTYSNKFNLPNMGGNLNPRQSPGHKPGNILGSGSFSLQVKDNLRGKIIGNTVKSGVINKNKEMVEGFENAVKIRWQ